MGGASPPIQRDTASARSFAAAMTVIFEPTSSSLKDAPRTWRTADRMDAVRHRFPSMLSSTIGFSNAMRSSSAACSSVRVRQLRTLSMQLIGLE
jgi:hypothetical protein